VRLIWSPLAVDRVSEIAQRIGEDRPLAAEAWVAEVFAATERLKLFPQRGRILPELPDRAELREIVLGRYRIIYRIEDKRVSILTVRHTRQLTGPDDLVP
jgi:toxin ParE1/3/4